ncbi:MAG: peptidoglycan-binding domain-containing protein [Pseudotabrizicola sp.]|uniref:peptidoglycan-binding domain-containing protein n=1 Tax=Pseudotabrizicola sp. TaxID=2939647 RepID=UPI002715B6EB|nr:peptidoglycan-binding domain-containing protein [Pseudotabrizicola sp.]MDO8884605.1 peptidoglycan-binding domain-containing protein [Pseudotabrizicola sp.]MDP2083486.1 peptidoglycan-binding domain-containing protein [Pseudotabrizicola sp.]MDZ7572871.1 peptidoglycan-binding domain-containing protein [Pseudotabrizicola sp.]
MKFKAIATAGIIAGLSLAPADQVHADAGDAIAGALIGGIIGHAIGRDQQKRRQVTTQRKSTKSAKPGVSNAQREANREVQTALNHFGYPVGTPDGAIGPRSRSAISSYQATLGYPPTGQLTDYERTVLVTAYHRAIAGGPVVAQAAATHPMGMKGLLLMQRDEMAGIPPAMVATPFAPAPVAPAGVIAAAPALPELMPEAPVVAAAPALPSFMGSGAAQVSLASQCNKISLMTNTNGGYVTEASMTDPAFALGEQFCLARTYAMATGEEMAAKIAGFTQSQIAEQCAGFGPVLAEHVAGLSMRTRDEVLVGVKGFVLGSGMSPAQLSGTAKICLGVGYTTDAMDVAVGSALLLTAMGEAGYAELLGHHLSQGFGATVRPELALDWYEMGLTAMGQGQAVFAPGLGDRGAVIRKAAYTAAGRAGDLAPVVVPAALPQFALAPEVAPELVPELATEATATQLLAPSAAPQVAETTPGILAPEQAGARVVMSAARLPFLLLGN